MNRFKYVVGQDEIDEVIRKDQEAGPQELTRDAYEAIIAQDQKKFMQWDAKLARANSHIIGYNDAMSQEAKQFGAKAGVNTGNGQFESRMSMHLFLALGASKYPDDPEWWKDDNKFYGFLREHPELDGRPNKHKSKGGITPTRENLLS